MEDLHKGQPHCSCRTTTCRHWTPPKALLTIFFLCYSLPSSLTTTTPQQQQHHFISSHSQPKKFWGSPCFGDPLLLLSPPRDLSTFEQRSRGRRNGGFQGKRTSSAEPFPLEPRSSIMVVTSIPDSVPKFGRCWVRRSYWCCFPLLCWCSLSQTTSIQHSDPRF
ncbi:uncharacterized protein LACBIDRAFT_304021 [Laccaria bicolor S238N-H82]|uniref:Predicted protein n=1 Tax=Laccaria bicolor (strain S238N-H82 / ATCC MYA-4686) TaxID=486041 RepID=B0DKS6_LACBS|nr:uncharacterized protein LACBIDRAFT_304021 [Laccaria bicolor S238N-H82]EDR04698.1 predicted protein [Laccaria bicolor S238N-H82]|eukprot:XP_001884522.1 predicted protein [Laccaria bicolor S238N-H82]